MTQDEHQMMLTRQAVERDGRAGKRDVGAFRANCSNTDGDFLETSSRQYGDGGLWVEITEKGKNSSVLLHDGYVRRLRDTLNDYLGEHDEPIVVLPFCDAWTKAAAAPKPNHPIGYILSSNPRQARNVAVDEWGWRQLTLYTFEKPDGGIVRMVETVDALRGLPRGIEVYRGNGWPALSPPEWDQIYIMWDDGTIRLVYPDTKQPEPYHFWMGEAA